MLRLIELGLRQLPHSDVMLSTLHPLSDLDWVDVHVCLRRQSRKRVRPFEPVVGRFHELTATPGATPPATLEIVIAALPFAKPCEPLAAAKTRPLSAFSRYRKQEPVNLALRETATYPGFSAQR